MPLKAKSSSFAGSFLTVNLRFHKKAKETETIYGEHFRTGAGGRD